MEGDGSDPCECYMENEFFMRRLLSLLRQSQSYCTDTECFVDSSSTQRSSDGSNDYFIVMSIFLAMYMFLHYWITQNRRNSIVEPQKKVNRKPGQDPHGRPPTPPPPTC